MGTQPGEIFRQFEKEFRRLHPISDQQAKVLKHVSQCRTAAMGGHVDRCTDCGQPEISYNSCRDRHCPRCQRGERTKWQRRETGRLPKECHHVVLKVKRPLRLHGDKDRLYESLFDAVHAILPNDGEVGIIAQLQTWGDNLAYDPHLHLLVVGTLKGEKWMPLVLSEAELNRRLQDHIRENLGRDAECSVWVRARKTRDVVAYLSKSCNQIPIPDLTLDGEFVVLKGRSETRLPVLEFIRRFLLHVIPHQFVRTRHFGLLSNRHAQRFAKILLALKEIPQLVLQPFIEFVRKCSLCGEKIVRCLDVPPRPD